MEQIMTVFILLIGFFLCFLICFRYKKRLTATMQTLLQRLDQAVGGKLQEVSYDESMDAAITERLNRIVQIASLNRERAELERDTVKELASDISHQIRTPLTNMMLYTGLLKEKLQENASQREVLQLAEKVEQQSEKLDFFIKELMKSVYAQQGLITLHPSMISIGEMIQTACQTVELAAMRKRIVFDMEENTSQAAWEELFCFADRKWTIEAIENILENAIKYSPEASVIQIEVIPYESFLCVQVTDQGIGILEEEQGLVFERFYRSKEVSREPGFGIGLYLVREVLVRQGGYVRINSKLGKGTKVQMFLSRREAL